jgi:hypothetical protein
MSAASMNAYYSQFMHPAAANFPNFMAGGYPAAAAAAAAMQGASGPGSNGAGGPAGVAGAPVGNPTTAGQPGRNPYWGSHHHQ